MLRCYSALLQCHNDEPGDMVGKSQNSKWSDPGNDRFGCYANEDGGEYSRIFIDHLTKNSQTVCL